MHAARRSLIVAMEEIVSHNQYTSAPSMRDWVSLMTFDRFSAALLRCPLGGGDADYGTAINTCVNLQATNDEGTSTSMEEGLIMSRVHLLPQSEGGFGREKTDRVVILVTDGLPNARISDSTTISTFVSRLAAQYRAEFYGDFRSRDAALMQVCMMRERNWEVYAVGVGAGANEDFMGRLARLGGTVRPYLAGDDPARYEQELTRLLREILNKTKVKLVD
jgi:hypothetical protein